MLPTRDFRYNFDKGLAEFENKINRLISCLQSIYNQSLQNQVISGIYAINSFSVKNKILSISITIKMNYASTDKTIISSYF